MKQTGTGGALTRLCGLADLLFEVRLSELQAASAARAASLDRLADLDLRPQASDLPEIAAAEVEMRYQNWADHRRADINLVLARQTAAWIEARDAAGQAFGKAQALRGLVQKLR